MYEKDTQISEKTINQVVEWYDRKVEMLREFQLGIHPFHRKLTFLKSIDDDRTPEKFIIITKKANDVKSDCTLRKIEQLKKNNFLEIPVSIIGIVDAQIHCALHNGISVVFEDDEIDENRISHYMNISREYNVLDIEEN